jgi:hypothetical protein
MIRHGLRRPRPGYGIQLMPRGGGMMTLLPRLDDESIAGGIARWEYAGFGRRPVDHVGRDLLFGSLARDYRAWPYHNFREGLPDWAAPVLEPARAAAWGPPRKALTNHLVLRLVHDLSLARLAGDDRGGMTQARHDTINALYACRPVGLAMEWHERDGRPHDYKCWRSRQCPWCHGRKVVRLYKRLMAGPCDPLQAGNKVLVMAKIRVEDDHESPEFLTAAGVDGVLGRWRPELLRYGRRLGMVGGLVGHQVGPLRVGGPGGHRAFRHDISVLGEVPCEVGGRWSWEEFRRLEVVAGFGERPDCPPCLWVEESEGAVPVEVTAMLMSSPMALRWLLAGSAGHPMWGDESQVRIKRNEAARTHGGNPAVRKRVGVDGALALQPSFLFTSDQFFSHQAAIGRRHLFAAFGSWKGASCEDDDVVRRQAPRAAPGQALQDRNRRRQRAASEAVDRLLPLAGRLFDELSIALGRAPGRQLLERRMAEAGSAVTRRQAVALVEALRGRPVAG